MTLGLLSQLLDLLVRLDPLRLQRLQFCFQAAPLCLKTFLLRFESVLRLLYLLPHLRLCLPVLNQPGFQFSPLIGIPGSCNLLLQRLLRLLLLLQFGFQLFAMLEGIGRHSLHHFTPVGCFAETASYRYNLETGAPKVYVVLRRSDDPTWPWRPQLATVAPDEAQASLEGGDDIVEGVAMPEAMLEWVAAFIAAHHVDEPTYKRQRQRHEEKRPVPARRAGSGR